MKLELVDPAPPPATTGGSRVPGPGDLRELLDALPTPAVPRASLVPLLRDHNAALGNPHTERLCRDLAHPRARVVVAGQQPGVFGGPLLLLAKAAAASVTARALQERHDGPVVPMFWNHSEDHDQDEAARLFVLHQGSIARRRAPLAPPRVSLDHLLVGPDLRRFAEGVLEELGRPDLEALLPAAGIPFPRWTSDVLRALLPDLPLLHAEPRVLRPLLGPLFERVIEDVEALGDALQEGVAAVRKQRREPQVEVRDASPLFLVAEDGRRLRLGHERGWSLRDPEAFGRGAAAEPGVDWLLELARSEPRAFSTNVLLRPVAQQFALPVVAQVCGPAESAYFEQLPELFAWARLPLPAVVGRPHVTLLGPREARVRRWAGLAAASLLEPGDWPAGEVLETLEPPPAGFSSARNARHHLAEWVRPRGRPQERLLGPLTLLPEGGPSGLQQALGALRPFDGRHHVITLEDDDD